MYPWPLPGSPQKFLCVWSAPVAVTVTHSQLSPFPSSRLSVSHPPGSISCTAWAVTLPHSMSGMCVPGAWAPSLPKVAWLEEHGFVLPPRSYLHVSLPHFPPSQSWSLPECSCQISSLPGIRPPMAVGCLPPWVPFLQVLGFCHVALPFWHSPSLPAFPFILLGKIPCHLNEWILNQILKASISVRA